jgi:argininosuccinate synthase
MKQRIVVAYSGSVAATAALRALVQQHPGDVVAVSVDVGQSSELEQVRDAALACGAVRAHVLDARDEFTRAYALPALQAGVDPGGWVPLIRTTGETVVAAKLREVADIEQAAVHPAIESHGPDENILGRIVSDDVYRLTRSGASAPDRPAVVELAFEQGVPVAINEVPMPLTELVESLAIIAGEHGVGRVGEPGSTPVEAPAASVLATALRIKMEGTVRMKLFKGTCEPVPELVSHT